MQAAVARRRSRLGLANAVALSRVEVDRVLGRAAAAATVVVVGVGGVGVRVRGGGGGGGSGR